MAAIPCKFRDARGAVCKARDIVAITSCLVLLRRQQRCCSDNPRCLLEAQARQARPQLRTLAVPEIDQEQRARVAVGKEHLIDQLALETGHGSGIQAKGTAVIHRADRLPHMNIELFSNAPVTTLEHYRAMGRNAALYAHGQAPEPVVVPVDGQSLAARYHVRVAMLYAIETGLVVPEAPPLELSMTLGQGGLST